MSLTLVGWLVGWQRDFIIFRTLFLSWKCQGGEEVWNHTDDVILLEVLDKKTKEDENVKTEDDIDWKKISEGWTKYYNYSKKCVLM